MNEIRSGQIYKWIGLPGQYDPDAFIVVDSVAADCRINARLVSRELNADGTAVPGVFTLTFVSISGADFVAAVEEGWYILSDDDILPMRLESALARIRDMIDR